MFTTKQLELLEVAIEHLDPMAPITGNEIRELRGVIATAIWNNTRALSKADQARVDKAKREGRVQVFTQPAHANDGGTGGWTLASSIEARRKAAPGPAAQAADGDSLLQALGL